MSKWIAEFELEDGDTMPEHMDLNYMGAKIDFHCRPMWIPVSERLPEDGTYLICTDDGYIATIMYDRNMGWLLDANIIAYMPLPEPYKTESEDKE